MHQISRTDQKLAHLQDVLSQAKRALETQPTPAELIAGAPRSHATRGATFAWRPASRWQGALRDFARQHKVSLSFLLAAWLAAFAAVYAVTVETNALPHADIGPPAAIADRLAP